VHLLEQAAEFSEVGAGVQLGPNVVRLLDAWGLTDALAAVAAFPAELHVHSALHGAVLGALPFGTRCVRAYGAAYATIARADLHGLLLGAVRSQGAVEIHLGTTVSAVSQTATHVQATVEIATVVHDPAQMQPAASRTFEADALIGADGLWSRVRQQVVQNDPPPRTKGHLAYRAMVRQSDLPSALRSGVVTAWMGHRFHAVQYPVRGGEWLNVVVIVESSLVADRQGSNDRGNSQGWDYKANAVDLHKALAGSCRPLRSLVEAIGNWRLWPLSDRPPLQSANQMLRGRIALLGDAAHPMLPYLAQGAGMAIEDAYVLAESLAASADVASGLQHYATTRWQRNGRVQARAIRNGQVFHLSGLPRVARDAAIRFLGPCLLDVPWLYRGVH
jgi:salicylate hydroxylase